MKLMVVEDERILRDGICRVGKWESHEIEICGAAGNGQEALELIEKQKPDIILTDVVMPVMDGIELARRVYEKYPEIRMIFLSGHDEFEYVKKAMEYKACDYLLKPAKIEEIERVVCEIRDDLLREEKRIQEEERLREKLNKSIPVLREHYMNTIVCSKGACGAFAASASGGFERDEKKIKSQFEFLNIDLDIRNMAVMICDPDGEQEEKIESRMYRIQLAEVCQAAIGDLYRCVVFTDMKDRIVIVLNYPETMRAKEILLYLQGKAVRIQTEMRETWGKTVSMGIGRIAGNVRYLPKAYKEAEFALSYRFFMGNQSIIYIGDIEKEEHRDLLPMEQQEEDLLACIKTGDVSGTKIGIEAYFALLGACAVYGQTFIYEEITGFVSTLLRELRTKVLDGEENFLQELEIFLEELRGKNLYTTLAELQEKTTSVLQNIAEKINHNRVMRNEGIIEKAKRYVQANLSGDVSLITVAESVFISPNYLSCLFKENGENFKDYIIRVKMEKAKEMIDSGNHTMSQIALMLGYKDGRYLSQVYKRYYEKH